MKFLRYLGDNNAFSHALSGKDIIIYIHKFKGHLCVNDNRNRKKNIAVGVDFVNVVEHLSSITQIGHHNSLSRYIQKK